MNPDVPAARVSHETIYAAIYAQPRGGPKAAMVEALRSAKPARGIRRATLASSAMVPKSLCIINRSENIEGRLVPGHWEGDLIKGAFNCSSVGTLVERKTRLNVLCSSSVKQSIRGIDCSAERPATGPGRCSTASPGR